MRAHCVEAEADKENFLKKVEDLKEWLYSLGPAPGSGRAPNPGGPRGPPGLGGAWGNVIQGMANPKSPIKNR